MMVRPIKHSRSLRGILPFCVLAAFPLLFGACGAANAPTTASSAPSAALATPTKAATSASQTETVTETKATTETGTGASKTGAMTETQGMTETGTTKTAAMTETQGMTETGATKTGTMTETKGMTGTEGAGAAAAAVVMLHENGTLGKILVDDKGMTLYVFDKDSKDKSACTGDCLTKWPPLTVASAGEKLTAEGVTGTLATIKREDDGKEQVTINGLPLYYYYEDKQAGDAKGQAVGDVWWVVGADGNKISQ